MTRHPPPCMHPRSSAPRSTSSPGGRSRTSPGIRGRDRSGRAPCMPGRAGGRDRAVAAHGGRAWQQARRRRHPGGRSVTWPAPRRLGVPPGLPGRQRHHPPAHPGPAGGMFRQRRQASAARRPLCHRGLRSRAATAATGRDRPTLPGWRAPPGVRHLRPGQPAAGLPPLLDQGRRCPDVPVSASLRVALGARPDGQGSRAWSCASGGADWNESPFTADSTGTVSVAEATARAADHVPLHRGCGYGRRRVRGLDRPRRAAGTLHPAAFGRCPLTRRERSTRQARALRPVHGHLATLTGSGSVIQVSNAVS